MQSTACSCNLCCTPDQHQKQNVTTPCPVKIYCQSCKNTVNYFFYQINLINYFLLSTVANTTKAKHKTLKIQFVTLEVVKSKNYISDKI